MVLGTGAAILYFKNLETVPYTNRTRFILRSKSFEREFGQSQMELLKLERIEAEAEYIGMLLMASAGYDPHVAIRMNEQQWVNKGKPELEDPLSTHPSEKRMAQILSQDHVMEEALSMYREALLSQKKESPVWIFRLLQLF
ncbi:hypothetical protein QJS04_geneDACA021620 [Acorus gramineus]|uniref:Peptidase M48 domain-containing protein n=1 Tax=Acorus gramineus TaxID=55184 RepID=A0AAV9B514_ACOGR|nr:hypothetical protein QJS04_geneDACA021620 [Acorus gramineus]